MLVCVVTPTKVPASRAETPTLCAESLMRAQFHHGFLSDRRGSARFRDHRSYRRLGWFGCASHETDRCLRQHAPQSGNAPTSHNQGSCQGRENHRNRWPGTTPCTSGSCANWVGLARYLSEVERLGGYRSVRSPNRLGSDTTVSESGGSAFVWGKEIEDGTHPRPRRRSRVHTRGRWTHYRLVSQIRRDRALRRLRCFHALRAEKPPELIVSPLTCLSRTALGWRKRFLVQPILRHGFIGGGFSVWRVQC